MIGSLLKGAMPSHSFMYAFAFCLLLALICMTLVGWEKRHEGFDASVFYRDPNATGNIPSYYGFFSNLGIFFWAGTTAILFFTAALAKEKGFFLVPGGLESFSWTGRCLHVP